MQTGAIWVKVHIPDEVLPFGLCLTYLYWISNFHLPFCLQSHLIFCNNSFLIHLAQVDWQKHVPFSRPWNWLSSRKLPGIVFPFPTTLNIYLISRHCFSFPYHPGNLSYFQAFSDQGTANSGCNGDATLKSVFNFWKNQVVGWLTSNKVRCSTSLYFSCLFCLTPTC